MVPASPEGALLFVTGFPAGPWGTNCFVVAPGRNSECIVIDPGMGSVDPLKEILADNKLRPIAVLLTHGHLDHTWSVVPVADGYGIPAFIHPDDEMMLSDPAQSLGPDMRHMLRQLVPDGELQLEPDDIKLLTDGERLELAGMTVDTDHAPGHTPGSVMYRHAATDDVPPLLFSGDVLFEGSIGRTDLPGGDHSAMLRSLRDVVLPMDDDTVVLPGHGGQTTIGRERATNPFLLEITSEQMLRPPEGGQRPPGSGQRPSGRGPLPPRRGM